MQATGQVSRCCKPLDTTALNNKRQCSTKQDNTGWHRMEDTGYKWTTTSHVDFACRQFIIPFNRKVTSLPGLYYRRKVVFTQSTPFRLKGVDTLGATLKRVGALGAPCGMRAERTFWTPPFWLKPQSKTPFLSCSMRRRNLSLKFHVNFFNLTLHGAVKFHEYFTW